MAQTLSDFPSTPDLDWHWPDWPWSPQWQVCPVGLPAWDPEQGQDTGPPATWHFAAQGTEDSHHHFCFRSPTTIGEYQVSYLTGLLSRLPGVTPSENVSYLPGAVAIQVILGTGGGFSVFFCSAFCFLLLLGLVVLMAFKLDSQLEKGGNPIGEEAPPMVGLAVHEPSLPRAQCCPGFLKEKEEAPHFRGRSGTGAAPWGVSGWQHFLGLSRQPLSDWRAMLTCARVCSGRMP